jgi:hypothetical protein
MDMQRELKKKQQEVTPCKVVARAINKLDATDYYVPDAGDQLTNCKEPADVLIMSESGAYPEREIQVVTVLSERDSGLRTDNSNLERFKRRLTEQLIEGGVDRCTLNVSLNRLSHRVPNLLIDQLVGLLRSVDRNEPWSKDWYDISAFSPEVARFVHLISCRPSVGLSILVPPLAGWVPSDGSWIKEAIGKKAVNKYAARDIRDMILVIDGLWVMDSEQVQSYLADVKTNQTLFAEAWIVFENRAVPLKRSDVRSGASGY